MRKTFALKRCAAAVALAMAGLPSAYGEEAGEVQKVEVTGSHIKRTDRETTSPVTIIGRDEIRAMGANTVQQVLANITSNSGDAISDLTGANSWASGASGVSLRNLGEASTLVLLNGRRLPAFGFADGLQTNFTNIDALPSSIIDHVEVLRDGASAIYGSDAIAGVINIITRKDVQGVTVEGTAQQSLASHRLDSERKANITAGRGDLDKDGYNVTAHLELYERGRITDRELRPHLPDWYVRMNPDRDALSTGSFPGNYVGYYPADYPDPALAGKRISTALPGCAPQNLQNGLCWYDYWQNSDARAPAKRATFLSSGRLKLSEDTEAYGELTVSATRDDYHTAPPRSNVNGVPTVWYNWNQHALQSFTDPQLPVEHPDNPYPFPIGVNTRFLDYPDMFMNIGEARQYRALGGLKGTSFGWDWDTALGTMGSYAEQRQHLYRDRYAYYDAIVNGEYRYGQQNPRELLERMFPEMGSHGRYRAQFFDLNATRELAKLDGGPLQVATGLSFKHESFLHESSDNIQQARIVGFSSVTIDGSRNVAGAYVELDAPVTKRLDLNLALRGDQAIGQAGAMVPKFGMKFKLTDDYMVRGTVSQGFRAPSIPETGNGGASWFNNGVADPKRCDTAIRMRDILKTGTNPEDQNDANLAYALGCSVSFPSAVRPNPDLRPEKSDSFTLGFVAQPTREISFTVDYYDIRRRDEITVIDMASTLANEDRIPGLVQRTGLTAEDLRLAQRVKEISGQSLGFDVGPISEIGQQYQNIGKTRVSGVDIEAKGTWNIADIGRFNLGLNLTRQLDVRYWNMYGNDYTENRVGRWGVPRYAVRLKPSLTRNDWSAGAIVRYTSGTTLSWGDDDTIGSIEGCAMRGIDAAACHIASDTTVDLWAEYRGWKNTIVSFNLFNAFDRKAVPILVPGTAARDAVRGRTIMGHIEYRF
jgi:iron complex outermembrane receptor protein